MKIVIIGGTGLIGSKLAPLLRSRGHEVLQASPSRGVNAVTGEGLQPAIAGADIADVGRSDSRRPRGYRVSSVALFAAEWDRADALESIV
jgi:nucleoside-diphosphate-sugar epimerase